VWGTLVKEGPNVALLFEKIYAALKRKRQRREEDKTNRILREAFDALMSCDA